MPRSKDGSGIAADGGKVGCLGRKFKKYTWLQYKNSNKSSATSSLKPGAKKSHDYTSTCLTTRMPKFLNAVWVWSRVASLQSSAASTSKHKRMLKY